MGSLHSWGNSVPCPRRISRTGGKRVAITRVKCDRHHYLPSSFSSNEPAKRKKTYPQFLVYINTGDLIKGGGYRNMVYIYTNQKMTVITVVD